MDLRSNHDENLPEPRYDRRRGTAALADACKQVETNLPLYTYQCQNHSSVNNIYPGCANNQWTCGFWPGEIWLAYEATGDEKFKTAALIQVDSFADRIARKVEVDHHDMGFLYSPTCVAAWKLVGSEKGKNAAIAAADQLLTRYQPSGRFLQAWGTMDDPDNYRYIIDCMLNVPLLYWAAQVTGSDHYREIAAAHTATTLANSFRPDGSTYHTFFMNRTAPPRADAPVRAIRMTASGHGDRRGACTAAPLATPTPTMKSFWMCSAKRWRFTFPACRRI